MDIQFFLRGLAIGFSIAAPVGPIGVLCIRRTLAEGSLFGLVSGLGAATADAFYGCIAGFGLTVLSSALVRQQGWLRLLGGAFLCYLGFRTFFARPAKEGISSGGKGLLGAYASTLLLTLTNPLTILSFAAIFAGLGVGGADGKYSSGATLVLGVFVGSALWWLTLSSGVGLLGKSFNSSRLRWVNRISGAVITAFGLAALFSAAAFVKDLSFF
jgi:threonine/homoserine/homoserine lactone efflux protein